MKIFTKSLFAAVILMAGLANASAQADNTFRFVDNAGNEIPDGGTYYTHAELVDKLPQMPGFVMVLEAPLDFYVENTTAETAYISAVVTTNSIASGTLQFCFPNQCETYQPVIETATGVIAAGAKMAMNSEWLPEDGKYGDAEFEIQLRVMKDNPLLPGNYTFAANGPKITVKCTYADPAGISDAALDGSASETSRYALDGRKLKEPSRGINIVRMSDGKTRKVLTK